MRAERIVRELSQAVPKAFPDAGPTAGAPAAALRAARAWVERHCLRRTAMLGRTRLREGREDPLLRYLEVVELLAADDDEATRALARVEAVTDATWLRDLELHAGPATRALVAERPVTRA